VIEGLRGEAADIAMDIGTEVLMKDDHTGLTVLTETLRSHIFPKKEAEAKVLYKHGHKKKGVLSRQSAEPIVSYVSRRRRWWTQLKQLDSSVELSDTIRGDLMLEAANLGKIESLLVLSSAGTDRKFEAIAKAKQDQHALIHLEEKSARKTDNHRWTQGKGHGKWKKTDRDRRQHFERKAHKAAVHDESAADEEDDPDQEPDDLEDEDQSDISEAGCYLAGDINEDDDPEAESKEDVELFVYMSMKNDVEEEENCRHSSSRSNVLCRLEQVREGTKER